MANASTEPRKGTWNAVVLDALRSFNGEVSLTLLYRLVESRGGKLIAGNPHWRDKVRQCVQVLGRNDLAVHVRKGVWAAKR